MPPIGLRCLCHLALLSSISLAGGGQSALESAQKALTPAEIESLRPVVVRDLRHLAATQANNSHVTRTELNRLFAHCTFSRIHLGSLGEAVVVEEQEFAGAGNLSMINVYVPAGKSWRRVAEGAGFGPRALESPRPVPDLVFGWGFGACHATYNRMRYKKDAYVVDACDQEMPSTNPNDDTSKLVVCESSRKLPTFPNPWPESSQ